MKNNEIAFSDYLIFTSGAGMFALPANVVREVLYPHTVTPLPFVPECIDGLINVEGNIAVQINFSHLHGQAHHQGKELILIDTGRALCALKADEVKGRRLVNTADITPLITSEYTAFHAEIDNIETEYFAGKFSTENHSVLIIDHQKIGELIQAGTAPENGRGILGKIVDNESFDEDMNISCLIIKSGDDRFALELSGIMEIVEADNCTPIPGAPAFLKGYQLVRGHALPAIDFVTAITGSNKERKYQWLVIAERNNVRYGLLVSDLDGIEDFPLDSYEPIVDSNSKYSGIFIHQNNSYALLSPNKIMDDHAFEAILNHTSPDKEQEIIYAEETERFLRIKIHQKNYGIPLGQVKRVSPFFPMTPLESADQTARGAIEIDGAIVPVMALDKSLALDDLGSEEEYVILEDNGEQWAICVDSALGIIEVPLSQIKSVSQENSQLVDSIASIEDKLLPLLDFSFFRHKKDMQSNGAY